MTTRTGLVSATATFTPGAAEHAAGDIMEGAKEFIFRHSNGRAFSGGHIKIISTHLLVAHTALVTSEADYSLHLYNVTPPSALAAAAAFDIPAGDRAAYLGKLALGTPVDLGSTLWIEVNNIFKVVKLLGASAYGYLATDATITPTAAGRTVTILGEAM